MASWAGPVFWPGPKQSPTASVPIFFVISFLFSITFITFFKITPNESKQNSKYFLKFKASFQDSKKQVFQMKQDFRENFINLDKRVLLAKCKIEIGFPKQSF
jgi:hypothetical protein